MRQKLFFTLLILVTAFVAVSAQDVLEPTLPPTIECYSNPSLDRYYVSDDHYEQFITETVSVFIAPADESETAIYYRVMCEDGYDQDAWWEYNFGELLTYTQRGSYKIEAYAQAEGKLPSEVVSADFIVVNDYMGGYFRVDDIFYKSYDHQTLTVTKDFQIGEFSASYSGDVIIPATVNIEGDVYTVTGIEGLTFDSPDVTRVVLPNTLTFIDYQAFIGSGISEINIPASVTYIGEEVFSNCGSLASITVDPDNVVYDSRNDCNAIIKTSTNRLLAGCQNTVIPASVTSIADKAFCGCTGLTSIAIPNNVTKIGFATFYGCTALTAVEIPNSVTSIENLAFDYCSALTSVVIPNSVTNIGNRAFEGCKSLTSVVLPNAITSINADVFCGCYALTDIEIPESVTKIAPSAFYACSSLTDVVIPDFVTSVGYVAFAECEALKSVTIGKSVTSLSSSFKGCSSMTDMTVLATTPPNASYIFSYNVNEDVGLFDQVTLFVPYESLEAYRSHKAWGKFTRIVPFNGAGPGDINGDGSLNVGDVTGIINLLVNAVDDAPAYCDVNGDGAVNINDVTMLINTLMNAQ